MRTFCAMEDRPREKLMGGAASNLSDVEVIAVILGTGCASEHVLRTAQNLLDAAENDLSRLAGLSLKDLLSIRGVGNAKALRLKAAIEYARRTQFLRVPEDFNVTTSHHAFRVFASNLGDLPHEEFWVAFLNRRSKVLRKTRISQGGISSTAVDPRIIFGEAMVRKASSIIVAHNHPSGNLTPSQADINLTRKLVEVGKVVDIQLVDHLIISGNKYCSFADSGLL